MRFFISRAAEDRDPAKWIARGHTEIVATLIPQTGYHRRRAK